MRGGFLSADPDFYAARCMLFAILCRVRPKKVGTSDKKYRLLQKKNHRKYKKDSPCMKKMKNF